MLRVKLAEGLYKIIGRGILSLSPVNDGGNAYFAEIGFYSVARSNGNYRILFLLCGVDLGLTVLYGHIFDFYVQKFAVAQAQFKCLIGLEGVDMYLYYLTVANGNDGFAKLFKLRNEGGVVK